MQLVKQHHKYCMVSEFVTNFAPIAYQKTVVLLSLGYAVTVE